jgi:hypothetical protein
VGERGVGDGLDVLEPLARPPLGLVRPRVLDRERGPVGGQLKELGVALREHAMTEHADVEDADGVAADDERHPQHRLDPLLPQDRVEHVRVVDVVEDDGPPLGGDAPREPLAERDAHAALDLLLDPHGRPRDELLRRLVEQEHRAGVGVEHVAGPHQERGEQLLEIEVRERSVREGLQASQPVGLFDPDRHPRDCARGSPRPCGRGPSA